MNDGAGESSLLVPRHEPDSAVGTRPCPDDFRCSIAAAVVYDDELVVKIEWLQGILHLPHQTLDVSRLVQGGHNQSKFFFRKILHPGLVHGWQSKREMAFTSASVVSTGRPVVAGTLFDSRMSPSATRINTGKSHDSLPRSIPAQFFAQSVAGRCPRWTVPRPSDEEQMCAVQERLGGSCA